MFELDEEGRRSMERRGRIGHYAAGVYRVLARPVAARRVILRVKGLAFWWGVDEAARYIERLPPRYIIPAIKALGATVGEGVIIGPGLHFVAANRARLDPLHIGRGALIAHRVLIDLAGDVFLGECCTLASDVRLTTHLDMGQSPLKAELYPVRTGPVRIERGAFVGTGATITAGVTVGECAVIGAGSVVLNDVPPWCFAAGSPARLIRELDRSKIPPFDTWPER